MRVSRRQGVNTDDWTRLVAPHDRERQRALARANDLTDLGGSVIIWYRQDAGRTSVQLAIQPGVADDLPALLSTLAAYIAWPGSEQADVALPHSHPERAIAVWARVWQVREQADLRLTLYWDDAETVHAAAELLADDHRTLMTEEEIVRLLNRLAVHPRSSETPHGLLLAGNRAMEAGDYHAARACYEEAVRYLPHHPEAHRNLALALARLGEWSDAARAMQRAWELTPDDTALAAEYLAVETDAGIHAVQQEDLSRAAEHFLRVLRTWPEEPTALANLGNIRLREGRLLEATAIFHRFLRLHPQHAVADKIRLALTQLEGE